MGQDLQTPRAERVGARKERLGLIRPPLPDQIDREIHQPLRLGRRELQRAPEMPFARGQIVRLGKDDAEQRMNRGVAGICAQGAQRCVVGCSQIAPREGFARTLQQLLKGLGHGSLWCADAARKCFEMSPRPRYYCDLRLSEDVGVASEREPAHALRNAIDAICIRISCVLPPLSLDSVQSARRTHRTESGGIQEIAVNRIYRVIWSKARHAWVVASELATGRGKNGRAVKRAALRTPTQESRLPKQAWLLRAAILATLLAHAPARAADRYWDINDTDPGLGGAGTWDLTNPIWGADDDGVSGPYSAWNNAALDDAFFTGTAGTVTLAAPIAVNDLNFLVHNYILNDSTLTLGGTTPTIHTPGNTTINSIIAGTAGLTKTGGGQLTLTGANTFSGGIFLEGGTLAADDDAALGVAGNVITTRANTSVGFAVSTGPVNRTVAIGDGGTVTVTGAAGQARYTGNGNVSVAAGSMLSNDASTYTGTTRFSGCSGVCTSSFTSIADLGIASSLGAPTTIANGTITFTSAAQYSDNLVYLGDGDSSNRNWSIGGSAAVIRNQGTGTLTLTGDVAGSGGTSFSALSADFQLLGVISGNGNFSFGGSAGRTVTLGGANTYTGTTGLGATVVAPVLANIGDNSSFGTGTGGGGGLITVGGVLSYTGTGASTDRPFSFSNGTLSNNGSGALTLTGAVSAPGSLTLGGSYTATDNTVSGVISGAGTLISNGAGTWVLAGANTRSGAVTVQNGTLRAGTAQALGTVTRRDRQRRHARSQQFQPDGPVADRHRRHAVARQRDADAEQRVRHDFLCRQHHRQRRAHEARLEHADAHRRQHVYRPDDDRRRHAQPELRADYRADQQHPLELIDAEPERRQSHRHRRRERGQHADLRRREHHGRHQQHQRDFRSRRQRHAQSRRHQPHRRSRRLRSADRAATSRRRT